MATREKGKGNTMVLPNIPKMTDDKNKIKYMTDYEKYEAELLKHHLGNPESTVTMGLKNIPVNFERTVPSQDEPTAAEVEYEKYLVALNARRKKKRFLNLRIISSLETGGKSNPTAEQMDTQKPLSSNIVLGNGESALHPLPAVLNHSSSAGGLPITSQSASVIHGNSWTSRHSSTSKGGAVADHFSAGEVAAVESGSTENASIAALPSAALPSSLSSSGNVGGEGVGKESMEEGGNGSRSSSKGLTQILSSSRRGFQKRSGSGQAEGAKIPTVTFPSPSAIIVSIPAGQSSSSLAPGATTDTSHSSSVAPVPNIRGDSIPRSTSSLRSQGASSTESSHSHSPVSGSVAKNRSLTESASSALPRASVGLNSGTGLTTKSSTNGGLGDQDSKKLKSIQGETASSQLSSSFPSTLPSHRRTSPSRKYPSFHRSCSSEPKSNREKASVEKHTPPFGRETPAFSSGHVVHEIQVEKKNLDPEEVEKYLLKNSPPLGHPSQTTSSNPISVGDTLSECADLLRVLIDPPKEYAASVKLDVKWFDIDWVVQKRRRPVQLTNVQNWQHLHHSVDQLPRLTSPRSVLALLRNGICAQDLTVEEKKEEDVRLPQESSVRTAVQNYRREREKGRREELVDFLLNDYLSICSKFSQQDLISAVNAPLDLAEQEDVRRSTSLAERQKKQQKQFEINTVRKERMTELAEKLHAKRKAAEERRRKAEEEQREALEAKVKSETEARRAQQFRLAEQRRKLEEIEQKNLENFKKRQELAERRNKELLLAQERQFELRQQTRKEKEEQGRKRFAHIALLQEKQAIEAQQKRKLAEEKTAKMEEMRQMKAMEEKKLLKEKQARVKEARDDASRRAATQEESIRKAAVQRQKDVELRLSHFMEVRNAQAVKRADAERVKMVKRMEARSISKHAEEEFKRQTEEKQAKHMEIYFELENKKLLDLTLSREKQREEMDSKAFAIKKLQRMEEFKKLRTISKLILKRKVAEHLEQQRAKLLEASLEERDKLYTEKQDLRERLAAEKV